MRKEKSNNYFGGVFHEVFTQFSFLILWLSFSVYKKHYPPALHDEVWRLDRIAKDGALHKKLVKANIVTVEGFLRLLVRDPQKLRSVSTHPSLLALSTLNCSK